MSKQKANKKRYKIWYYSLAVCVVACFVAAFGIFGTSPGNKDTSDIVSKKPSENREVAAKVTNVPDARKSAEKPPLEATPQTPDKAEEEITEKIAGDTPDFSDNVPFESKFILPANSDIMKDYSDGKFVYSKENGDYRIHNGIDFKGKSGSPVVAIISGEVTDIKTDPVYGTVVEINHGNKLTARYCGISKITVEKGFVVNQGDSIGEISTIPSEGDTPHLHFETLIDGAHEDPLAVMGKADKAS